MVRLLEQMPIETRVDPFAPLAELAAMYSGFLPKRVHLQASAYLSSSDRFPQAASSREKQRNEIFARCGQHALCTRSTSGSISGGKRRERGWLSSCANAMTS